MNCGPSRSPNGSVGLDVPPEQDQDLADGMHRLGTGTAADFVQRPLPFGALQRRGPDLDQLMRCERAIHLGDQLQGDALVPDQDHRLEIVRASLQLAPLRRGQRDD